MTFNINYAKVFIDWRRPIEFESKKRLASIGRENIILLLPDYWRNPILINLKAEIFRKVDRREEIVGRKKNF